MCLCVIVCVSVCLYNLIAVLAVPFQAPLSFHVYVRLCLFQCLCLCLYLCLCLCLCVCVSIQSVVADNHGRVRKDTWDLAARS